MIDCKDCKLACGMWPKNMHKGEFHLLWQCDSKITEVGEKSFTVCDTTDPEKLSEILIEDISEGADRKLIKLGALLRECEGYLDSLGGHRAHVNVKVFIR